MTDILLWILTLPPLIAAAYLFLLAVLSAPLTVPAGSGSALRFVVLVPAHDEAACIARTVESLLALDWPMAQRRIVVVADNCTDDTAARARSVGATVLDRHDAERRGKGYALEFGFARVLDEGWADAVVVVDADTEVSRNLLGAFAARFGSGAQAVQAFYGVLNPRASWRTELMVIALAMMHRLRGRGRERMKVSAGLKGNGMGFTVAAIATVPHRAFSIVEDLEQAIALARAGIRVVFVDEAEVRGEMVSGAQAASSQRQRWEGGRRAMLAEHAWPLLRDSLRRRSPLLLDLAMEVLVPPLASLVLTLLLLTALDLVAVLTGVASFSGSVPLLFAWLFVTGYVLRGVMLSGLGMHAWLALARAPLYVIWKLSLRVRRGPGGAWIRTRREDAAHQDSR